MAFALKRSIAPVYETPARPSVDKADSQLNISVVFTSVQATLSALREAGRLMSNLGGYITLIVPQVVPYPLPLASPPVLADFSERRLRVIADTCRVETRVRICLCRDPLEAIQSVLEPHALVVVGSRKKWWPTTEKRLAAKLRSFGHEVVVTERARSFREG